MVQLAVVAILIAALAIILISCKIFTNGVEWLGLRLGLAETATGSILAAVGTAMPETIIPLIAIFLGTAEQGEEIGEGSILGAPFMLGTLAMFIGGVTVWYAFRKGRRTDHLILRKDHAKRDMKYFMIMYLVALFSGLVGLEESIDRTYLNYGLAVLLLAAYAHYIRHTLKDEVEEGENSCPSLYACKICQLNPAKGRLGFALIFLQVASALMGIIIGAKFFVTEVEKVSISLGVSPMILAFLIAPVATELPEKFNSVIWYLRSKDTLAFGNITGAMVFQASFPVSIGLVFTHWQLAPINIASVLIALSASGWMFLSISRKGGISYRMMLVPGSLYILYLVMLVVFGPGEIAH